MSNPFQQICAQTYGEGDFSHVENLDQVRETRDTLFAFLMIELGTSEGCDNREEALRRLEMAMADIQRVIDAVDQMPDV